MEASKRTRPNRLKKKIDQGIRKTGFDKNFINAVKFHLEVINKKTEESYHMSKQDYCNLLMSKLFINKIDLYPTKRFKCQVNEYSDWPISLLPSEVFGEAKLSDAYRRNSFYECLQVGDVLDCRVASVLPTEYHLRVINKYGATRILDDLNITVVMLRNDFELLPSGKELFHCELIRVIVSKIKRDDEYKIFVTVRGNIKETGECGRISEEELPSYVLDPPEYSTSYSDYLRSVQAFHNPILLNNIIEGFGIDPRGVYTFYSTFESVKPVDANLLLRDANLSTVKYYTDLALQGLENESKQLLEARRLVQKAIELYPMKNLTQNDKVELSKLYEIKGNINAELKNPEISKIALLDWKLARNIDPTNQGPNKHLSRVLFLHSNNFYKAKDYKKAAKFAERALKLDENNENASALLEYLKSEHPEVFSILEGASLDDLEEKKNELVNELKKFMSSNN